MPPRKVQQGIEVVGRQRGVVVEGEDVVTAAGAGQHVFKCSVHCAGPPQVAVAPKERHLGELLGQCDVGAVSRAVVDDSDLKSRQLCSAGTSDRRA